MEWNDREGIEKATQIIKTLLEMSVSDGDFDESEVIYILKVGETIGLDKDIMEDIIRNRKSIEFVPPTSEEDRMAFLYYSLFMMKADNKITEEERNLVYKIGFRLGFNELLLTDLIKVMEKYLTNKVPPHALLKKIKKYLN